MILGRQIKRPTYTKTDRLRLVLLARAVRAWRQALFLVRPETLLRWHRQGLRLFWKHRSHGMRNEISASERRSEWRSSMENRSFCVILRGLTILDSRVLATWDIRSKKYA